VQAIQKGQPGPDEAFGAGNGRQERRIVLSGADWRKSAYDVLFSAFVSAGQRCTAASRAIVVGDARRFAQRIVQLARKLSIGHPFDDGVFMGPLASPAALEMFERGIRAAERRPCWTRAGSSPGASRLLREPFVHFVGSGGARPTSANSCSARPRRLSQPSEERRWQIANATDYGLAASVHTRSEQAFDRCQRALECGVVNWNARPWARAGGCLSGDLKRSRQSPSRALWSTLY